MTKRSGIGSIRGCAYGFPDLASLRDEARQARELPRMRQAFEQLHLNRWGDGSAAGWVDMLVWDEGGGPIDMDALHGRDCWIGCDLSKSYDLTAIVAAFPEATAGGYTVLTFPFLPADTLRRRAETSDAPWRRWADDGHVHVIPGAVIDEDVIEAKIRELLRHLRGAGNRLRSEVRRASDGAARRRRPAGGRTPAIEPALHRGDHRVPARRDRPRAAARRAPGAALVRRNVAPVTTDTGLVRFSKNRSADAIDCAVAAAMAIGRAAKGGGGSVYNDEEARPEGLLFV